MLLGYMNGMEPDRSRVDHARSVCEIQERDRSLLREFRVTQLAYVIDFRRADNKW